MFEVREVYEKAWWRYRGIERKICCDLVFLITEAPVGLFGICLKGTLLNRANQLKSLEESDGRGSVA